MRNLIKAPRVELLLMTAALMFFSVGGRANDGYWQQHVIYHMDIEFDVNTHQFTGTQSIKYTNNSPDTLMRVFYHLYFNAFQPGSMMDTRSRTILDPDPRVGNRIYELADDEIGYQKIEALKQDGKKIKFDVQGTILAVDLKAPILPGQATLLEMEFKAQVPLQIRRSGRDNAEGISYSMTQWYPKLCEYDRDGWHPNPYVGREFYGVWGDFNVSITIDSDYTIGGSGYLQNAADIGHGYTEEEVTLTEDKLTWHFKAPNVHDFMWAADPDYVHETLEIDGGPTLHFFYDTATANVASWHQLPAIMEKALVYMNAHFGEYPYEQYSFVHGGDGGMEYPMATLITGNRPLVSLVGVSVHEWMHSWYQMVLGTNESLYHWMDEGFTSYATSMVMNELSRQELLPGRPYQENPMEISYQTFREFMMTGYHESLSTHADHFLTNLGYGRAAYTKGSIYLHQLRYIIGADAFDRTLLRYYDTWKFKHPRDLDFIRIAEKESGMVLDWYHEYWVNQTHPIDYAIGEVTAQDKNSTVTIARKMPMPMPVEVEVVRTNGRSVNYYIPLRLMRGSKRVPKGKNWEELDAWPWTHQTYTIELPFSADEIERIIIDPDAGVMDLDPADNVYPKPQSEEGGRSE